MSQYYVIIIKLNVFDVRLIIFNSKVLNLTHLGPKNIIFSPMKMKISFFNLKMLKHR